MVLSFAAEPCPLKYDKDGVIRVGNTRVTLDLVIDAFSDGATAEENCTSISLFKLADVYQVIGYYLRHSDEINRYLHKRAIAANEARKNNESLFDPQGIRSRLMSRRDDQS